MSTEDTPVLGGYLRAARQRQGETLAAVAERARIKVSYLSEIERGHRSVPATTACALANALRLPPGAVLWRAACAVWGREATAAVISYLTAEYLGRLAAECAAEDEAAS